jgi:polysaccharide pyruvyl transferase WcaK-like protein
MWYRPLWQLRPWDARLGPNTILMGAGWYQVQPRPDPYTRWLYRSLLNATALQSVRDGYSERMLRSAGFANVVNTGCPTIWRFTPERCEGVPKERAAHVVTTLNTYMRDAERDRKLLSILQKSYRKVFVWPQTDSDAAYARDLDAGMTFVEPSLRAYDRLLASEPELDYVGLRLHGGIRALQHHRRSIIVEIDNRASEMGADFHLPTVKKGDWERLESLIAQPFATRVTPPLEAIRRWKGQFQASGR